MPQIALPTEITPNEVLRESSLGGAISLCAKAAGLEGKQIQAELKLDKAQRFAQSHAGRILAVFQSSSSCSWTAHELAIQTGLTVVQIDRRLPELPQIERTGVSIDGFTAWRLKHEPCFFDVAGEADGRALRGTN